jgi:hypothetical protein
VAGHNSCAKVKLQFDAICNTNVHAYSSNLLAGPRCRAAGQLYIGDDLTACVVAMLQQQEGLVVAEEDSQLLLLDAATYSATLTNGFDGQLNDKLSVLQACPALTACLSTKSDLRGLAYASVRETVPWGAQLYGAAGSSTGNTGGGLPDALYIIQQGTCLVSLHIQLLPSRAHNEQ